MNNHCAKFRYKGKKTVGVMDYTNQTPSEKLFLFKTPKNEQLSMKCVQVQHLSKMGTFLSNVHKIKDAYRQCVNNH